jgi:hypothetical protein
VTVRGLLTALAAAAALAFTCTADATAPPVVRLPPGPHASITTQRGQLVSIALPHRAGRSWRLARRVNPSVLREISEADVGNSVVIVFRAVGRGTANVVYALTRGESTTASASSTHTVRVR